MLGLPTCTSGASISLANLDSAPAVGSSTARPSGGTYITGVEASIHHEYYAFPTSVVLDIG